MTTEQIGFAVLTAIDILAAGILFAGALNERMRLYPAWHKIGLILASFGLFAQAWRNLAFLTTGHSATDADLPFWVLKDLGIATIAFFYLAIAIKTKMAEKNAAQIPAAPVRAAKKPPAKKPRAR